MINITKDTIIGDILDVAPQTAPIFLSIGMHCLGCPSSRGETVEEACMVHGIDVDKLLALVNEEANKAQYLHHATGRIRDTVYVLNHARNERKVFVNGKERCVRKTQKGFSARFQSNGFSHEKPTPQERSSCGDAYGIPYAS